MEEPGSRPPGWLGRQLAARPVATNSAITGLINVVAELLRHWLTLGSQAAPDPVNVARQFAIGSVVMSPLGTCWHALVEQLFHGWEASSALTVFCKTAAEQVLFAPVVNSSFMLSQGLLEGQTVDEVCLELQSKFVGVMRRNFAFWVPTCFAQYKFVAPRFRVLFSSMMSVVWMMILISKTSKATSSKPALVAAPAEVAGKPALAAAPAEAASKPAAVSAPAEAASKPPAVSALAEVAAAAPVASAAPAQAADAKPAEEPAPEPDGEPPKPNHGGSWVLDHVSGDWDGFLKEVGQPWWKRKVFRSMGYGVEKMRLIVEQDGDNFKLTNIAMAITSMSFTVGKGKQDGTTMEGNPMVVEPVWDGEVLQCDCTSESGEELPCRHQYFMDKHLVVDLVSLKGICAKRFYRRE